MKTIRTDGQSKLVEYEQGGRIRRGILPANSDDTGLAIPYGLPFAALLEQAGKAPAEALEIERKLHEAGIWTEADVTPEIAAWLDVKLPQAGLPDLRQLDWHDVADSLGKLLASKGLYTLPDAQRNPKDFEWCIKTALVKPLLRLYRENQDDDS